MAPQLGASRAKYNNEAPQDEGEDQEDDDDDDEEGEDTDQVEGGYPGDRDEVVPQELRELRRRLEYLKNLYNIKEQVLLLIMPPPHGLEA